MTSTKPRTRLSKKASTGALAATNDSSAEIPNHVLVVDDAETNLLFAEYILGKVNPEGSVTCVDSAQRALEVLRKHPADYSLCLIDVEMPEMDGIECVKQLRSFNTELSVVALTAHGDDPEVSSRCLSAGMDGVASKPFREASIAKVIATYNGKLSICAGAMKTRVQSPRAHVSAWNRGFYLEAKSGIIIEKYLNALSGRGKKVTGKEKEKNRTAFTNALGFMQDPNRFVPIEADVKDASAGLGFTVLALKDGTVVVQGSSSIPESIYPSPEDKGKYTLATPITNVQAGHHHIIAWAASTKQIFSWGLNVARPKSSQICGQLGRGALESSSSGPGPVAIDGNVLEVACGVAHSLVLTDVGLFGFGLNSSGEVGQKTVEYIQVPTSIFVGNNVVTTVACGHHHSLCITAAGSVLSWGSNSKGQCGQPESVATVTQPSLIPNLSETVTAAAGGATHSLVLSAKGVVYSWGGNSHHQLGRRCGDTHEHSAVQGALARLLVHRISCGSNFSIAVDSTGVSWAWGSLQAQGGTKHAKLPEKIDTSLMGKNQILKISSAGYHCCALATDGEVSSTHASGTSTPTYDPDFNEKTASMTLSAKVLNAMIKRKKSSSNMMTNLRASPNSRSAAPAESRSSDSHSELRSSFSSTGSLVEQTLIQSTLSSSSLSMAYESPDRPSTQVHNAYSEYRRRFLGQNHFLAVASSHVGCKIVAVLLHPVLGEYPAVVFSKYGIFKMQIDQKRVIGQGHASTDSDLRIKLLTYFINYGYHDMDQKLAGFPLEYSLKSREDPSEITWHAINTKMHTSLSNNLLSLETRLGLSKRVTVGVICNVDGDAPDQVYQNEKNTKDPDFLKFCKLLGSTVSKKDWPHFNGRLGDNDEISKICYTSWRGFEIVFHLAPTMTAEMRRQFIGNNKCLIIFSKAPVQAVFRGSVNSVAVVVQSLNKEKATTFKGTPSKPGWRVGVYFRSKLWNFFPCGFSSSLITSQTSMRNIVLSNVINGCASATLCQSAFKIAFENEVDSLVESMLPDEN